PARRWILAAVHALVTKVGRLVEGELEADRIDRDDRREKRGRAADAAGDKIADGDAAIADAAVDRRADFAVFVEIKLGLVDDRLVRLPRRLGNAPRLGALVEHLFADGLLAHQLAPARHVVFRIGEVRLRLGEVGARLLEHDFERAAVDSEEKIALLDHLAV